MSKDMMTTITGVVMAAMVGFKEYLAVQQGEDVMSWQFAVGAISATLVAAFGYWAKKGE